MDNKLLVFIFGLFIIYFLCKKNKIRGGEKANIESGDSKNSEKIEELKNYSEKELEMALKNKKIKKELNDMPRIHSEMTNYKLYLELGSHSKAYDSIKNGEYWAQKAFSIADSKKDFDTVMKKNITEREEKYFSILNSYKIKKNMEQQNKMKNTNKENKTVLCPDKSKREFCEGKNDCWETNYCECPEAQKLCKNNMAEKIMKDFNINDNEEKDRILNIFHGNSSVLYNLSNTEKQVETNTTKIAPTQAKKQVDESTQESPPAVEQPKKQTQADAEAAEKIQKQEQIQAQEETAEKIQEQEQAQAEIAAQIQEQEQAQAQMAAQIQEQAQMAAQIQEQEQVQAQMAAQIQEQEQMQAQAVTAQTNMTGGMNMLEETMEILNKFHGGSINYQKF